MIVLTSDVVGNNKYCECYRSKSI